VVSDTIALSKISNAANTGTLKPANAPGVEDTCVGRSPIVRPRMMYIKTGITTDPIAPNVSLTKILISNHVSCSKPRILNP
jgi:hypothetical protein